jgi:hypothetical protein
VELGRWELHIEVGRRAGAEVAQAAEIRDEKSEDQAVAPVAATDQGLLRNFHKKQRLRLLLGHN